MTGIELRCDRRETDRQIFNTAFLQACFKTRSEMAAADQAGAGQTDIEVAQHASHGERARPGLQIVHFLGGIAAADNGTDGCADDHVGNDAVRFKSADHTDVGKTAGGAAAKCKADGRTRWRRLRMRRCFRRPVAVARSRENTLENQASFLLCAEADGSVSTQRYCWRSVVTET